jgi:hypothetical protein
LQLTLFRFGAFGTSERKKRVFYNAGYPPLNRVTGGGKGCPILLNDC